MKRTLCLLLALIMIMGSTAALAVAPTITNGKVLYPSETWSSAISHSEKKGIYSFVLNTFANVTSAIYEAATGNLYTGVTNNQAYETGNVRPEWNGVNKEGWHPDRGGSIDLTLKVEAANSEGSVVKEVPFTFYSGHNMSSHTETVIPEVTYDPFEPVVPVEPEEPVAPVEPEEPAEPVEEFINPYTESRTVTYSHNTVCSFGPHFRNVSPELTDKWYMFTALDLSQDGRQVYEIVGGNTFVIGCVTIDVQGDNVTVTYDYVPGVWGYEEFFTFFHDYDDVTTVNPSEIDEKYEYEKTYSIADDLDGDTSVLLFMCNVATFKSDNKALTFFYENLDERKALRQAMLDMIGKVEVTEPYRVN